VQVSPSAPIAYAGVPPKFLFKNMHYVYILRSLADNNLYIGYTNNLKQRFEKHKAGKIFSTSFRAPLKLAYYEAYLDENDARKREKFFKTGWGRNYIKRVLKGTLLK
jgi:putative endonuclease